MRDCAGVLAIVFANAGVFALELRANDQAFVSAFALIPYDVTHGIVLPDPSPPFAFLTLVTAPFVHASTAHIAGNLIVLGLVGPFVERALGTERFLAFYVTCGTLGSVACVVADPGSHVPIVGASGAIAGLLGAYLILSPLAKAGPLGLFVPILLIGGWAFVQIEHGFSTVPGATGSSTGTAYFAHIGGFLAGVIAISPFTRSHSTTAGRRKR